MELKKNPSKDVHRQSGMFFFLGLGISICLVICAFEWKTLKSDLQRSDLSCTLPAFALMDPNVTVLEVKVPKVVPVVKKAALIPEKVIETNLNIAASDDSVVFADPVITPDVPAFSPMEAPIEKTEEPVVFAEVMPMPVGGYDAMYKFLSREIKYPTRAKHDGVEGKVFVEFVINRSGLPENIKVVKGIHATCDAEAMRVVAMTKWEAGRQGGKAAKVRMVLPISFRLQ